MATQSAPMLSAVEAFRQMLWGHTVIRVLISHEEASDIHPEMTVVTTVYIYKALADEYQNKFYPGLVYRDQQPSWRWDGIGLEARYLRQPIDALFEDIDTLLTEWKSVSPFLQAKPLVVCERQADGSVSELFEVPLDVIFVLMKMSTAIGYELRLSDKLTDDVKRKINSSFYGSDKPKIGEHNGWTLSGIDHSLTDLVKRLRQDPTVQISWTQR